MKFNLVLSIIFCVIYSINCQDTKLEQICIEDAFDYNDLEVNSFFHVQLPLVIPSLNDLLISESIKFEYWSDDEDEVKEMYSKKTEYNYLIKKYYNQENVNNFDVKKLLEIKHKIIKIRNYFKTKENIANAEEYEELQDSIKISYINLGNLISLKKGRLNSEIVDLELLAHLTMNLLETLDKDGVLAFGDAEKDGFFEKFYAHNIARFEELSFDEEDEDEMKNKISIYVPVHKFKYNTREKCTNSIDLPDFYREN